MKNICRILLLGFLGMLFFSMIRTHVVAQEGNTQQEESVRTVQENAEQGTIKKKSQYQLPYPGILQDHPLYILKQMRDSVIEALISDPVKKSEFVLLQSDKFLNASIFLNAKGKKELGMQTMKQGESYMSTTVSTLTTLKQGGTEIPGSVIDHLERSLEKHEEVVNEQIASETGGNKAVLSGLLDTIRTHEANVEKLK